MSSLPSVRLSQYRTDVSDPLFLVYRRLFSELEKAAIHAHGALLDIGCGNKPYERMFRGRVTRYTGCDVAQSSEHKVDIISPATAIPVPPASFDTVLCTQVIEHVADHQALLREAFRVLRPEGVLILSGPMYWHLHEEPHDYFRFTEYGLRHLLQQAAFENIRIRANGGKWALCGQVLIHSLAGTRFYGRIAIQLINRFFSRLDDRHPNYSNTLNYVVVAFKR